MILRRALPILLAAGAGALEDADSGFPDKPRLDRVPGHGNHP